MILTLAHACQALAEIQSREPIVSSAIAALDRTRYTPGTAAELRSLYRAELADLALRRAACARMQAGAIAANDEGRDAA